MTALELRRLIGQCEAAGHTHGVVKMRRPAQGYVRPRVEIAPLVYGLEIGRHGDDLFVSVDVPSLRQVLRLVELGEHPPQGSV